MTVDRRTKRTPWGKLYGDLWRHPKWLTLSKGARALWASALSWTSETRTFGDIPAPMLVMWQATPEEAAELVAVGLWETTREGWALHDWNDHQTPRERFEETSAKRAESGRNGGRKSTTKKATTSANKQSASKLLSKSEAPAEQPESNGQADIDVDADVDEHLPPGPPPGGTGDGLFPAPAKPTRRRTGVYSDAFERAWKAYPAAGRQAKKAAGGAWEKAITRADPETIQAGIERYAAYIEATGRETKWMQGWLNDDRWEDENHVPAPRAQYGRPTTEQNVRAAAEVAAYWQQQDQQNPSVSSNRRLSA